uniref:Dynein_AAA_lid domain-containing protein n=1 Tax=Schistosoma mansoni TaxID=6183 RepID=A0A5K4F1H0_SCHMA
MNFSEILRNLLFPHLPPTTSSIHNIEVPISNNNNTDHINNKLCLLLSHGNAVHELFFVECINQFLQNYTATTTIHQSPFPATISIDDNNNNDNNTVPDHQHSTTKCLIFCFHKSWNIYHKLLNPLYTNNITLKNNLTIIDMTVMLENLLVMSNSNSELNNNDKSLMTDENIGTIIKNYIKEKTDEFLKNSYTTNPSNGMQQHNVGIFVDNISALYDLGVTIRELEQFLCSWLYHSHDPQTAINITNLLVCIGLHVGDFFQDSIVSEYEPALVHLVALWKSRASITLECKPLLTGYTSLVDGQLTCWKRSTEDKISLQNVTTSSTYHFHVEGKHINCYTPGTTKLLT